MALGDITQAAVLQAIDEYDALGRESFLDKYGFQDAKRYWLIRDGKHYPSKAIAGVAHKYVAGQQVLNSNSFTGGEGTVVKMLRSLGFTIEGSARNPDWTRDELILALDLYLSNPSSPPRQDSPEVRELSDLLNKMHRISGTPGTTTLRNLNGVYLKMMNLRAIDPAFKAQGKSGMNRGSTMDEIVWAEYAGRRSQLAADALTIRNLIADADESKISKLPEAEPYEGEEGGVIVRLHKRYERDPKLVRKKREEAKASGSLKCEVCEFDFAQRYGALGADFIEVHHTKPVHQMKSGSKTKLADLALLCSNCHRMAHRKRVPLSLEEISASLRLDAE